MLLLLLLCFSRLAYGDTCLDSMISIPLLSLWLPRQTHATTFMMIMMTLLLPRVVVFVVVVVVVFVAVDDGLLLLLLLFFSLLLAINIMSAIRFKRSQIDRSKFRIFFIENNNNPGTRNQYNSNRKHWRTKVGQNHRTWPSHCKFNGYHWIGKVGIEFGDLIKGKIIKTSTPSSLPPLVSRVSTPDGNGIRYNALSRPKVV